MYKILLSLLLLVVSFLLSEQHQLALIVYYCHLIDKLCMVGSYFTPDTYANEHSARAARLAAGLCADLASAIVSGRTKNGFALV